MKDGQDAEEFEQACRSAFVAFSGSNIDVALEEITAKAIADELRDEAVLGVVSNEALLGLGGVLVGTALSALGAGAATRRRNHADEGDRVRELDAAFRSALTEHLGNPRDEGAEIRARAVGYQLRDALIEWHKKSAQARPAATELDELIDGPAEPHIGKLGDSDRVEEYSRNTRAMQQKMRSLHVKVAAVADAIGRFGRLGHSDPKAELTPRDADGVLTETKEDAAGSHQ
jgi:hypothetical protein